MLIFLDEHNYVSKHNIYENFKSGAIKNPYDKSIYGIGYLGDGKDDNMKEMNTNQVVNLLLSGENEIANKFHNTVTEILRLGYDSDRGKALIPDLIESVQYSLEEIERIINR